jgi:hypothetical protein
MLLDLILHPSLLGFRGTHGQLSSGTILIAPQGHSDSHTPQPLQ